MSTSDEDSKVGGAVDDRPPPHDIDSEEESEAETGIDPENDPGGDKATSLDAPRVLTAPAWPVHSPNDLWSK